MDKYSFDKQQNLLRSNYTIFKRLTLLLGLINAMLVILMFSALNKEKIILVPQVAPSYKMWVSQSGISPEYLTALTRNVLDLTLNLTPGNARAQHQELLNLVTPAYSHDMQEILTRIDKQVVDNNLSQNFYIRDIRVINNKNVVYVTGTLNTYIDKSLSSSVSQIYRLRFNVNNYAITLSTLDLINDNDAELKELNHG